ncbi:hypothetical protein BZA77DRAFT_361634 [Pyronema omphalodes]|nr:hypothetical protein BZA77DRAFT_361634 [Pyronema omphalodes]
MPPFGKGYFRPKFNRGILDNPRWIYRHLIRQSRALYDDVARTWWTKHIRERFEEHLKDDIYEKMTVARIAAARKGIKTLARANCGMPKPLTKIMETAYGRIGKRRHELLLPILHYNKPILERGDPRQALPYQPEPFLKLLRWANVKNLKVEIPEKNIWDQPFPESRKPRIYHLQHTRLLEACPAPLPMDEWTKLKQYADGEATPPPSRRKHELQLVKELREAPVDLIHGRPHNMSSRSWRRLYTRILEQTPTIKWPQKKGEEIEIISVPKGAEIPDGEPDDFATFENELKESEWEAKINGVKLSKRERFIERERAKFLGDEMEKKRQENDRKVFEETKAKFKKMIEEDEKAAMQKALMEKKLQEQALKAQRDLNTSKKYNRDFKNWSGPNNPADGAIRKINVRD